MIGPKNLLFVFFISCSCNLFAQVYENLVFEGGGIRGIAYCGAIQVLQDQNKLNDLKRVGGTSAGAIQASLLAIRYTPQEIAKIIAELNLSQFNDGRMIFFGGTRRVWKNYGWYRGDEFLAWIGKQIEGKTGDANLTFKQLHDRVATDKFKDLYITATNLSTQRPMILSFENYPDMRIKDAVRISMSIPLYFGAAFMDSTGAITYRPRKNNRYDVLVDGGILKNFPIDIFDQEKYMNESSSSNTYQFNSRTLGLRLDSPDQIAYDSTENGLAPVKIDGLKSFVSAFYTMVIENLNRPSLKPEDRDRTISISTENIGPRVRKIPARVRDTLIESGKKSALAFLKK